MRHNIWETYFERIWIRAKSTNVALGKMSGSEGKHGQTAEHGQYFVLPVREYPAVTL